MCTQKYQHESYTTSSCGISVPSSPTFFLFLSQPDTLRSKKLDIFLFLGSVSPLHLKVVLLPTTARVLRVPPRSTCVSCVSFPRNQTKHLPVEQGLPVSKTRRDVCPSESRSVPLVRSTGVYTVGVPSLDRLDLGLRA